MKHLLHVEAIESENHILLVVFTPERTYRTFLLLLLSSHADSFGFISWGFKIYMRFLPPPQYS